LCSRILCFHRCQTTRPATSKANATTGTEMAMATIVLPPPGGEVGGGGAGGGAGGDEGGGGEGKGGDGGGGDGGGDLGGGGATARGTATLVSTTGGATVSILTPMAPLAASVLEMLEGGSEVRFAAASWIDARFAAIAEAAVVLLLPLPPDDAGAA